MAPGRIRTQPVSAFAARSIRRPMTKPPARHRPLTAPRHLFELIDRPWRYDRGMQNDETLDLKCPRPGNDEQCKQMKLCAGAGSFCRQRLAGLDKSPHQHQLSGDDRCRHRLQIEHHLRRRAAVHEPIYQSVQQNKLCDQKHGEHGNAFDPIGAALASAVIREMTNANAKEQTLQSIVQAICLSCHEGQVSAVA